MERQRGAALVVVLSMLTMSLMLGLSGMQSSLIDERLAGNYKAQSEAQMNAENAASEKFAILRGSDELPPPGDADELAEGFDWNAFSSFSDGRPECGISLGDRVSCFIKIPDGGRFGKGSGYYIIAMGSVSDGERAVSEPVFVMLSIDGWNGFGPPSAVSLPGGIDENISNNALQWPTSENSKISGADGFLDGDGNQIDVAAMSILQGDGLLDIESAYEDKAGLDGDTVLPLSREPVAFVSLIKSMYDEYKDAPSANYPDVHFYTGNDQMDFTGNHSLSGVHIVLNGAVQIGGNSNLDGTLIVLNVDDLDAENWSLSPATFVKLNGGGGDGTVWFDSQKIADALISFGLTLDDFYGVSAEETLISEVQGIDKWF